MSVRIIFPSIACFSFGIGGSSFRVFPSYLRSDISAIVSSVVTDNALITAGSLAVLASYVVGNCSSIISVIAISNFRIYVSIVIPFDNSGFGSRKIVASFIFELSRTPYFNAVKIQ